jgi:hypothetical protein
MKFAAAFTYDRRDEESSQIPSAHRAMKPAIVVTGAASGIGRELARVAAQEGSVMVFLDQSQQALKEPCHFVISCPTPWSFA